MSPSQIKLTFCVLLLSLTACKEHNFKIITPTGEPVAGAQILFANKHGTVEQASSDGNGRFAFNADDFPAASLTPSHQVFTIEKEGFLSRTLIDPSKKDITVTLQLSNSDLDSDSDGLTDEEELAVGTDPFNWDSDGDSLSDSIETKVTQEIGFVSLGLNPLHKNVLLEVDHVAADAKARLYGLGERLLRLAFSRAPVENPDGTTGIDLIIDNGQFGGGTAVDRPIDWDWFNDSIDEARQENMSSIRQGYFYYSLVVATIDQGAAYGLGQFYGPSHIIVGKFFGIEPIDGIVQAGNLMHEIGHNFGLDHGGDEETRCKPNYFSVMNYNPMIQIASMSYSSGTNAPLDESRLDENVGIGHGPIDWNRNNVIDEELIEADINHVTPDSFVDKFISLLPLEQIPILARAFSDTRCADGEISVLRDHNDWALVENTLGRMFADSFKPESTEVSYDESFPLGQ